MSRSLNILLLLSALGTLAPASSANTGAEATAVRLRIGAQTLQASLVDNATTRDFLKLLPLTLTLEDYASTEKIAALPRALSTSGAPPSSTPVAGNIAYYAPWGNLAFFYGNGHPSTGLILLGTLGGAAEVLRRAGRVQVHIERVQP